MQWAAIVLDWLKLPQRVLWGLVAVAASMLWGPPWFINGLGLQDFINDYRKYLGVIFLVLLTPTATAIFTSLSDLGRAAWSRRQLARRRVQRLHDLSDPEKVLLRRYISGNTRSQTLEMADGVTQGLQAVQIIGRASEVSRVMTRFD
jgi:Super-infection exclusion protein B